MNNNLFRVLMVMAHSMLLMSRCLVGASRFLIEFCNWPHNFPSNRTAYLQQFIARTYGSSHSVDSTLPSF